MSNILTYPTIPIVAGDDVMIISDVSIEGNPTRSVSVDQLGAYIGAGGGGPAGVTSLNTLIGAINLVGGTDINLATVGNTITINSAGGSGGTVTSLSTSVVGDAMLAVVANPTTTPNIAFQFTGNALQYINGKGFLRNLSDIPTNLTLAVTRTTGDATLTGNVLDIPNYGSAGGSGVTQIVAGTNITVNPSGGTGAVTVNSTDQFTGTVTSVGVSSNHLTVGNTPITSNGTISVDVPVSGVIAGVYANANITVDQYGFVTGAANGSGGSTNPAGSDTQVQYNSSGAFGAGAFFTTNKSSKIEIKNELGLVGDNTNQGLLKLYCESGTAHYVGIKGPNHSGGNSYTLQLPNTLPSVANQILESNASGTLSWIATPSGGSGTVTSVTGNQGIVMTGSSAAPVVNVDYAGTNNYILTGTQVIPSTPQLTILDNMPFSTIRAGEVVYYTTVADVVETGNGYKSVALRLTPNGSLAPTVTVVKNDLGSTISVAKLAVGSYVLSTSGGSGNFGSNVIAFIENPNEIGTASNIFPQITNIRLKAVTEIAIRSFNAALLPGGLADLVGTFDICVEIKIYP